MSDDKYPTHTQLHVIKDKSQIIGEFLEWLGEKGIILASYYEEAGLSPYYVDIQKLLAEFFCIDLDMLEKEKQEMLEEIRNANNVSREPDDRRPVRAGDEDSQQEES